VVKADAQQLHVHVVEEEAAVGVEAEGADAEGGFGAVENFAALVSGDALKLGAERVERGGVGGPEGGRGDGELVLERGDVVRFDGDVGRVRGDFGAGRVEHGQPERGGRPRVLAILDAGFDGDCGGLRRDAWRGDERAPVGDRKRIGDAETDVAVDARAGVPARVGDLGVVDADG
jgi:hypothetical protein